MAVLVVAAAVVVAVFNDNGTGYDSYRAWTYLLLLEQAQALQQRQAGPNGAGRFVVQLILRLGAIRILVVGAHA